MPLNSDLTREQSNELYEECLNAGDPDCLRRLCREDLFFLLERGCKRWDFDCAYLYARVREVEAAPDGFLDLWFRESRKSTIITFGLTIQDILKDPEETFGIFSHTSPIAKAFLSQIKRELETNTFFKELFPEILYRDPQRESPVWSLDKGIIVKRKSNPKESTVEAHGLVDGQPTSAHYGVLIYDDVVTKDSVTSPDMIQKTTAGWEMSLNLGAERIMPDGTKRQCRKRYSGTRYHHDDTYKTIIDRGAAKPRMYFPTDLGQKDIDVVGKPVFFSLDYLREKRKSMAIYSYGCFVGDTKILMSDWKEKSIKEIRTGDTVVGIQMPKGRGNKNRLVRSCVLATNSHEEEVYKFMFESGRHVICTRGHKFFTGRRGHDVGGTDTHLAYVQLGFKKQETKSAISVYDPRRINYCQDKEKAAWLSGIFDGEGSVSAGAVAIYQSHGHNPEVCERIESVLKDLNFDYGVWKHPGRMLRGKLTKSASMFYIRGGRQEKMRFLNICKPARSRQVVESLFKMGCRDIGDSAKDKLVSIVPLGKTTVYNIQTETVNFIADGYAVKNSQMLQNPTADAVAGFNLDWWETYTRMVDVEGWNLYLLVDSANEKKKTSDYTVMVVIGLGPDNNYYLLDGIRDRLNLTERTEKLFEFHRKWPQIKNHVGWEKYGKDSDIQHIQYVMEEKNYRFGIIELGGAMPKNDRIRRLVPIFETHRFFMPVRLLYTTHDGKAADFVKQIRDDEYITFPMGSHDDGMDCIARITDEDMKAVFPKITKPMVHPNLVSRETSYDPMAVPK